LTHQKRGRRQKNDSRKKLSSKIHLLFSNCGLNLNTLGQSTEHHGALYRCSSCWKRSPSLAGYGRGLENRQPAVNGPVDHRLVCYTLPGTKDNSRKVPQIEQALREERGFVWAGRWYRKFGKWSKIKEAPHVGA
jgi:hypothetical protein